MVERVCPTCRNANPLDDRYCGFCGKAVRDDALVPTGGALLPVLQRLPREQLQQVGAALALGAAALAAEIGMAWLKRRTGATPGTVPLNPLQRQGRGATIVSQRIIETWERGELVRKVVDRHVWQRDEHSS